MSKLNNSPEVGTTYIRLLIGSQLFCYLPSMFTLDELLSGKQLIIILAFIVSIFSLYRNRIVMEIDNKFLTFVHFGMLLNSLIISHVFKYYDLWKFNVPVFVLGLIIWLTLIYKNVRIR